MSKVHREAQIYLIVGLLFACDQLVKWLALALSGDGFSIIPSFLRFELYLNQKIFFVIPLPNLLIIAASIFILVLLLVFIIRSDRADNERALWEYALIFAGGLSNLIDRIRVGASIDYVTFDTAASPFFNLGDLMIVAGCILIIFSIGRSRTTVQPTIDTNPPRA